MPWLSLVEDESTVGMKIGMAWKQPNQSAYDFRSDTVTTPTPSILRAIVESGFSDGWTGGGDTKNLEDHISQLTGKESTMFMVSSTLANQVALWAHLDRHPAGVLCDIRTHMLHMEAGSLAMLAGALPQPVVPSNGLYITLEDVKRKVVLMDGSKPASACDCPTRVIHLENPLGGNIMPLEEMRKIKAFAEKNNIKVNLDGARLWDAVSAGAGSLEDLSAVADSVNLSMSKGIGAPVGTTLSGTSDFMIRAKGIHKSMGGAMRQPGILAAAVRAAIDDTFGFDTNGKASQFKNSHHMAKHLAQHWIKLGGSLLVPQETNMIWLDLASLGISESRWIEEAKEYGVLLHSCRIVTHYQISEDAVKGLEQYMTHMISSFSKDLPSEFPENEAVSRLAACMQDVYHQRKHSI